MYHIIINPISGKGKTVFHLPVMVEFFKKNVMDVTVHQTQHIGHGYEIAKTICTSDSEGIIGIGGDGTFQEIVSGMVDAFPHGSKIPVPLGVFPGGSGNDFVMALEGNKSLALNKYRQKVEIAVANFFEAVVQKRTIPIDVLTANNTAFLNIGNIGLDARIVRNAAELKNKHGGRAYLASVYKSIAQHKNINLTIRVNGEEFQRPVTLFAVCNGQYYGGGIRISPNASISDGKITLCIVNAMSRPKTMVLFPSIMVEKHMKLKAVNHIECTEVSVTLPPGVETLCLDGNLFVKEGTINFKILPGVLDCFK